MAEDTLTSSSSSSNDTDTQSPHRLIASNRVEGTAVYNRAGEKLGRIENFMVDKVSGRSEYAVMSFGGFPNAAGASARAWRKSGRCQDV